MGQYHAHDTLLAFQNARPSGAFKDNLNRKCYSKQFNENSGLAKALRLLQEETPSVITKMLRNGKEDKAATPFSQDAFKTLSMVNFETGWTLTGDNYMEWAKGNTISLHKVADELDITDYTPFVPMKYLEKERDTRAKLVNHITGLDMLEALTDKLTDQPATASYTQAISRHLSAQLKDFTLDWITAKLDIRRFVLQGQTSVPASNLLKSNIWEPTLFGKTTVSVEKNRNTMNMCLQKNIGLTKHYNAGIKGFGRNTQPEELETGYISRRYKDFSGVNSNRGPSHKRRHTKKPYEHHNSYSHATDKYHTSDSTHNNRKVQQQKSTWIRGDHIQQQTQNKDTQNNKTKPKNYGKGKYRNFQKNKK